MALDITIYSDGDVARLMELQQQFAASLGNDAAITFGTPRTAERITREVALEMGAPMVPTSWTLARLDKERIEVAQEQVRAMMKEIANGGAVFALLEGETVFS